MKTIVRAFVSAIAALSIPFAVVSCGQKQLDPEEEAEEAYLSVSGLAAFPASETTLATYRVKSNINWTVSASDSWVTVDPTYGSGSSSLKVKVVANIAGEGEAAPARSATVTITPAGQGDTKVTGLSSVTAVKIDIKQDAETVVFAVTGEDAEVPAEGATVYATVKHNVAYTTSISADWITAVEGTATKAVKTDNLSFAVAENTAQEARQATITFKSTLGEEKITIKQAAAASKLPEGFTDLSQPLVWKTNGNYTYTEEHNPDWSTSGGNSYSKGTGKGIVVPEGNFAARGQWHQGPDKSISYTNVTITAAEGHYTVKSTWTDDAMIFTVPVTNLPAGKAIKFETGLMGTAAVPKYWVCEFSNDCENWTIGKSDNYYTSTQNGGRANVLLTGTKVRALMSATFSGYQPNVEKDTVYIRIRCVDGTLTITGKSAITTPSTTSGFRICDYDSVVGPTVSLVDGDPDEQTDEINGTKIESGNNLCGLISDKNGAGIVGVPVTDGFHYVLTDVNGVYQMKAADKCRKVYYSLPADYKIAVDPSTSLPLFYSTKDLDLTSVNRRDFTLEKRSTAVTNFKIVAIADPQVDADADITRFKNETIADITKADLGSDELVGLVLGDLVNSQNKEWAGIKAAISNVTNTPSGQTIPFYSILGNHDLDITANNQYDAEQLFYNYLGPVDYSFNVGKVHFINMNNVQGTESSGTAWTYTSGLTADQLQWLKEDLANVADKSDKLCIVSLHMCIDTDEALYSTLLEALTEFNGAHILLGHSHLNMNKIHDNYRTKNGLPIYEHVQGAACGAYWSSALNTDDSPINYDVYEIHGNTMYDWYFKPVGYPKDWQIRVFNGNDSYTGAMGYTYSWAGGHTSNDAGVTIWYDPALAGCFVASVWNSDNHYWKVELYKNDVKQGDMSLAAVVANASTCAFYCNSGHNKALYTPAYNPHHYYWKPASADPSAETGWKIVATQTIPDSGVTHTYTATSFQNGYDGYTTVPTI